MKNVKEKPFTLFPGVEILWKGTISESVESPETLRKMCLFHKISAPRNLMKFRYFTQ